MNAPKNMNAKALKTLAAMEDWVTVIDIAAVRNAGRNPTERALSVLLAKGLVERTATPGPRNTFRWRRTNAGSVLLGIMPTCLRADPLPPPTGSNPFEWKNYLQPFPGERDLYENQHRNLSEKATYHI